MVLKFHKKNFHKFEDYFLKVLKFMKLEFPKLKYPKSSKSLHISEIMVN